MRSDCWLYLGPFNPQGYGIYCMKMAHRLAYESFVGPIPDGLTIDHLCRTRHCINPRHLEPVTNKENVLRGESLSAINAKKTHCPKGHPYFGKNLLIRPAGSRSCRACAAICGKKYRKENWSFILAYLREYKREWRKRKRLESVGN